MSVVKSFPPRLANLFIDDEHRTLANRLLDWSRSQSSTPRDPEHIHRAFYASTFGYLCAPRSATLEQVFVSLKFLMLFFLVDDLAAEQMKRVAVRSEPGSDFERYYADLMSEFTRMGRATETFNYRLQDLIAANEREKSGSFSIHDEAEILALRKVLVGIPAYTACWTTIRGIALSPEHPRLRQQLARLLDITCELACLVNDIASFARDAEAMMLAQPGLVDINLVLLLLQRTEPEAYPKPHLVSDAQRGAALAQLSTRARQTALPASIGRYNDKVTEFCSIERELLHIAGGLPPTVRAYLEGLHCAIVGDLRSTKHLVPLRYPEALHDLDQLLSLDDLD